MVDNKPAQHFIDSFGRVHNYLRISIAERCNLRCTYCMPEEGVNLSPASHLMTSDEIYKISKVFVDRGINKIRISGGEPLIRKDIREILSQLATLPVELAITTNGVILSRFVSFFKEIGLQKINISLDSLQAEKFNLITRRNYFDRVYNNILELSNDSYFSIKVNVVLIKGFNDNEIIDFIELTRHQNVNIRFIEFMPFSGNQWDMSKTLFYPEVLDILQKHYVENSFSKIADSPNDTSKNYQLQGAKGSFGFISSVSNPFCDTCNRIRLTANGQIKNCLFSSSETDILTPFRQGQDIAPIIEQTMQSKAKIRNGMDTLDKLKDPKLHSRNRSMVAIGG